MNLSEYMRRKKLEHILDVAMVFCFLGCFACCVYAFNSIKQSEEETDALRDGDYSAKQYVALSRIRSAYTFLPSLYWETVILQSKPIAYWEHKKTYMKEELNKRGFSLDEDEAELQKAIAADFRIAPNNVTDESILRRFNELQQRLPEARRRQSFRERLKDMMAFASGAIFLGMAGWFLKKAWNKTRVTRGVYEQPITIESDS